MTFTVVGTPGDRRVTLFAAACTAAGLPPPEVAAWRDVLEGAEPSFRPGTLLRLDSPGEDAACDALLRGPGDPTRVGGGARWHATFTAALHRVASAARRDGAVPLNDADEIAVMFDKRRCHTRLQAAGVPVPPALDGPVHDYAHLRERLAEAGWSRVFVKPAHGSSASGVVALQFSRDRVKAVTSAAPAPGGGYRNSLRVRAYETEHEVAALVDALAPDGLHVEKWLPKAALDGRVLDLRVVVVAGVPTHAVVRTSRSPMTNLHLGGRRGDLAAVRAVLGEDRWQRALAVCAAAARSFPRSLMTGVDLLVGIGWRRFAVAEVNAFGDLLPGLPGLPGGPAEGLDTYAAQVRAALTRSPEACAS
ncbi:MAG TPA: STM4014 family protein [Thermomonospora sp.]|nr:STM4014 family protein [Thermomonospora sp.]